MKKASCIVGCTLLVGLSIGTASAQPVTVKMTGHVTQVQDKAGVISQYLPYLPPSQAVTAEYTYDTVEPSIPGDPAGYYAPLPTQTNLSISIGSLTFQSTSASQYYLVVRIPPNTKFNKGEFSVSAQNDTAFPDGTPVDTIQFGFIDASGQWPTSMDPPAGAPPLANLSEAEMSISGLVNQNLYEIDIQIDSVTLVSALEISPAAGTFLPQQHFDAAVLLPTTCSTDRNHAG